MDNYKIKVNDEAESKEAQELFFELGLTKEDFDDYKFPYYVASYNDGAFSNYILGSDTSGWEELTLPQLRDLVVLKRNDVKDKTHRDKRDESIYLTSDKVIYYWQGEWCKSAINKSNDYENYIANSLTPIAKPQAPALISGAEAKLAWANGVDIQIKNVNCVNWYDLDESKYNLDIFDNVRVDFRLKPQTIKLELELPKPFEPEEGEKYWWINPNAKLGYEWDTNDLERTDFNRIAMSVWRTEDEIKQVVAQLRKIRGAS